MKIYRYNGRCNLSGRAIRDARVEMGLSQEQLAARMQVEGIPLTQKAISRIESGERVVADYELKVFAAVLGLSVLELLEGE